MGQPSELGLEESPSCRGGKQRTSKLFCATYLQPRGRRLCRKAVACPQPALADAGHGKTPATRFWTSAPSIFQSCRWWVLATCGCLLAVETQVPSYMLGIKWGADLTWGGKCCPVWPRAAAYPHLQCRAMALLLPLDVKRRCRWSVI